MRRRRRVQEDRARHWARLTAEGAPAGGGQVGGWQAADPLRELLAAPTAGAEAAAAAAEVVQDIPHLAPGLLNAGLEG
jgi:hypothetical protein